MMPLYEQPRSSSSDPVERLRGCSARRDRPIEESSHMLTPDDLFRRRGSGGHLPSLVDMIDASGDCWEWTGSIRNGYGRVWADGRRRTIHRVIWEALVGPIPDGLEIDHLCRNTICCNPDHLEPVTRSVNVQRGIKRNGRADRTHCPQGHPYSGENLYIPERGGRGCRTCRREIQRRYQQRKRAQLQEGPA